MTTPRTQVERIADRFGVTLYGLARIANRDISCVYRWSYPKSRGGTGGAIPATAMAHLANQARVYGVLLQPSDFDPRPL